MKHTQKFFALLLVSALLLALAGCTSTPRTPEEDRQRLISILDNLSANLHPGTAGSSLSSARFAAELISWASTTSLSKEETIQLVSDWVKVQSPQIREVLQEKFSSVQASFRHIVADGAADLLADAGIDADFSTLAPKLKDMVTAILATGGLD